MKLLAACPVYDGRVCGETASSLLDERMLAHGLDIEMRVAFVPGCSLVQLARDKIAKEFLESDADRLFMFDSDVSWELGALMKMLRHDVGVVAGAYRYKSDDENYPVHFKPGDLWAENGLLAVDVVPGGFIAIKRHVFERMRAAFPDRGYDHKGERLFSYFNARHEGGNLLGEDTAFCVDWRKIGGTVWLDPELKLTHHGGARGFPGHIGTWLKNRKPDEP